MARLTDLTRTLSNSTGVPQASLAVIARVLREAGLVSTGTRGPGAQMGSADVASLLLALAAQGHHLKAADSVKEIGAQRLASVAQIASASLSLSYGQCVAEDFGLFLDQDLMGALSSVIDQYSVHSRSEILVTSSEKGASGPIGFAESLKALNEEIVLPEVDRTPCSITIRLTRRLGECFPEVLVKDADGRISSLAFSSSGEVLAHAKQYIGIETAVIIHPWVAHAAVCCIRGIDVSDHPFNIEAGRGI